MNTTLSRLFAVALVSLSFASVACSAEPVESEELASEPSVELAGDVRANAIGDLEAVVVTKCIRTYAGSCDAFKISCKRSGGKLEGSVPGQNGEFFVWTCTK